jgi:spore coat polysaccharide biosynthesis protein SpsF (cytidylyltransferase family)
MASVREATEASDREHVTTWITREAHRFVRIAPSAPAPLRRPDLRFTIDTPEDLEYMRTLFARTGVDLPPLRRLIEAAGRYAREVA